MILMLYGWQISIVQVCPCFSSDVVDLFIYPELFSSPASLYMLATASNIPMKLLTASALNVLIAIYRILTDESLSSEQMCQLYESLCAGSKTHDWLDVCYHPDTWDTLSELSKSPLFTGIHAGMWSLLHFAHGGEEGLPLNVSGVSD